MSADSAIIIISYGCLGIEEYRVSTMYAVDNITVKRDIRVIRSVFGNKEVFTDLHDARIEAIRLEAEYTNMMGMGTEYGISVFRYGDTSPFELVS